MKTELTPAPDAVPLDQLQARLLQQLAAELARQIRDDLRSGRLIVQDGCICSNIKVSQKENS